MADMSRYAARPERNWLRMLKSKPSVVLDVETAVEDRTRELNFTAFGNALLRICFDLVKIMIAGG